MSESRQYTVKQLADLSGVTVRLLHHYDHIGLLRPSARTEAGYRMYGPLDLLRLQQILFYRALEVPLARIRPILDDPAFDTTAALRDHRRALVDRVGVLQELVRTIDRTLTRLEMEEDTMTDEELYQGFSATDIAEMEREVDERYDPELVAQSRRRVGRMSKEEWRVIQAEGDVVTRALVDCMHCEPDAPAVQELVARHHAWIEQFYDCDMQVYRGLGDLYVGDPRFRAYYENYAAGLAAFLRAAIQVFVKRRGG